MKLLIIFIILNILNVIFQTVRSLATVKCGKAVAAIVNAFTYALYTVVIVYTVCELPLWLKALIVGICNLVGVYIVKLIEEKARKDKLWLVKVTIPIDKIETALTRLDVNDISYSFIKVDKYYVFDCYCSTQAETIIVTDMAKVVNGKCFATENKL